MSAVRGLFMLLALLGGSAAQADVLTLTSPSPYAVIGVQCGTGTTATTAIGFTADGDYITGLTSVSTRCGGSGRGGGYHTTTYSGCGITRWDLAGRLIDITSVACSAPDPTAVFTSDGYTESTASSSVLLVRPDVLPSYAWTAEPAIAAPAGQSTPVTETLTDTSAVPLHVYSVQATGYDVTSCTGVDLQPGGSCDVVIQVYPSSADVTSLAIPFTASTNAATEASIVQTVNVTEGPDAPPQPAAPQVPALPPLAFGVLAVGLGVAGRHGLRRVRITSRA